MFRVSDDWNTHEPAENIGRYSPLALIERERHVLGEIAAGVPLNQVLENLLRAVEAEAGNSMMASVLFLSEDGKRMLHGAAPSLPAAYNQAIDGISIGIGIGSCGTAAALGKPVYASDIATDPLWKDFSELALGHGLRACWSTPIKAADGSVLGTFAVYYGEPRAPTSVDIAAISFITQTAALAIERHQSDLRLQRSKTELRLINTDLERQVRDRAIERDRTWQLSRDLLVVTSSAGIFEAVNPAWTQILGWEGQELIGANFADYAHPDDVPALREAVTNLLSALLVIPFEHRLRHKDGSYRWFAWNGAFEDGRILCQWPRCNA